MLASQALPQEARQQCAAACSAAVQTLLSLGTPSDDQAPPQAASQEQAEAVRPASPTVETAEVPSGSSPAPAEPAAGQPAPASTDQPTAANETGSSISASEAGPASDAPLQAAAASMGSQPASLAEQLAAARLLLGLLSWLSQDPAHSSVPGWLGGTISALMRDGAVEQEASLAAAWAAGLLAQPYTRCALSSSA